MKGHLMPADQKAWSSASEEIAEALPDLPVGGRLLIEVVRDSRRGLVMVKLIKAVPIKSENNFAEGLTSNR